MTAARVAVVVMILAVAVVGVQPAAAVFGQPAGIYAVTRISGSTSVDAHIIGLLRGAEVAVIELGAAGTFVAGPATPGPAASGMRLTGTGFTAAGVDAGTFDLTINPGAEYLIIVSDQTRTHRASRWRTS